MCHFLSESSYPIVEVHFKISVTRLAINCNLGNFPKHVATISVPKSSTFLGNFCKVVKIFNFSSEIIFGQLL